MTPRIPPGLLTKHSPGAPLLRARAGRVNICPQEIENVLASHPKVQDVAVVGVPNEELGKEVEAVVQATDPTSAGPELANELIAWCRTHLAHYKCSRSIDFEAALPRLPTGKLHKQPLRARYWPTPPDKR
jgi:acyl-CoA synthetase (AMP-forming)/AMP-acid ligase II